MSRKAAEYLSKQDPVLATIIEGQAIPKSMKNTDVYRELIRSIIGQQLHVRAAETIVGRFFDQFDDGYPHPEKIVRRKIETMRKAGLSQRKAEYIQAVAAFHLEHGILCLESEP